MLWRSKLRLPKYDRARWRAGLHLGIWWLLFALPIFIATLVASRLPSQAYLRTGGPQPYGVLQALGLLVTALGLLYSLWAAHDAHKAKVDTAFLIKTHEDTQLMIAESPKPYERVFYVHVQRPFEEPPSKLRSVELLISTPAYGYHVLGNRAFVPFRKLIADATLSKEIILFSPDPHYYHVANIILWDGIERDRKQAKHYPHRDAIEPVELARHIADIMSLLATQLTDDREPTDAQPLNGQPIVNVWVTPRAQLRMSTFRYDTSTRAHLILVDDVNLLSDLREFTGRALSLPAGLHRQLVGDLNRDDDSFFDSFKRCPYTANKGIEASVTRSELLMLQWDYLLLRTQHPIVDIFTFDRQLRHLVQTKYEDAPDPNAKLKEYMTSTAELAVKYFTTVLGWAAPEEYVPHGQHTQATLLAGTPELLAQLKAATAPAQMKSFRTTLMEHARETHTSAELQGYLDQDTNSDLLPAIAFLYFILASGYGQSRLVATRIKPPQEQDDSAAA